MIIQRLLATIALVFLLSHTHAQRYKAYDGHISFFSEAPIEDIQANNSKVSSIFVPSEGTIAFSVVIKDFQFPKKLMQEHFNDKYLESERFPRSTFTGRITGFSPSTSGLQSVRAKGQLSIHGITRDIDVPGTIQVRDDALLMKSKFKIVLADYGVEIPKLLWKNISDQVEVTIDLTYKKQ